jgi:hypothetical protein
MRLITRNEWEVNRYNSHARGIDHPFYQKGPPVVKIKPNPFKKGEDHPNAKLTAEKVREIRYRVANGEGKRAVARLFGISCPNLLAIIQGKTWTHVQ